ncbi:Beta-lactamase SHV-24 precursor [Ruegeria atlantica]|uniref:Beta-lactamase n=1 Tax=Ruegeria atlantica TaxID=81569 RepID=A0A0P1EAF5_9RHOB|nr:Beta-lactamase SHV-24 precursor [Ruegeria atlantica]
MRGLRRIKTNFLFLITITVGLATSAQAQTLTETVQSWERRLDARIGLLLYDPSNEWEVSYRADELFPMSSTFKPLLCGAVLAEVDAGTESLSDHVTYQSADLVDYSPVTSKHVETGMMSERYAKQR